MALGDDNIRNILVETAKALTNVDDFIALDLQYEKQIYLSPTITWLEGGAPLELQICDGGDMTLDRDGSVRREQINIQVAILMRRPTQFKGQHASILTQLHEDLQSYRRAIRSALDGNFLENITLIEGADPVDLLVRPLVYVGSGPIMSRGDYPDLMIKELRFTGGINDPLG